MSFAKIHTETETWSFANKHPREAIRKCLELRTKVEFLNVSQPTRLAGVTCSLQAIVNMPANCLILALRTNGVDNAFVRSLIENYQNRLLYRAVPSH